MVKKQKHYKKSKRKKSEKKKQLNIKNWKIMGLNVFKEHIDTYFTTMIFLKSIDNIFSETLCI